MAVLDTGASAVILGRTFANRIRKCRPPYLSHGDSFITAGGREDMSLGRGKLPLDFVLAKGTSEETLVNTTILIADTEAYDVILGMDFWGRALGILTHSPKNFFGEWTIMRSSTCLRGWQECQPNAGGTTNNG